MANSRECPCGSGEPSWWEHDARGIPLARVCDKCVERKLSGYRRDVLSDPNYEADEAIDGDDEDELETDPENIYGLPGIRQSIEEDRK